MNSSNAPPPWLLPTILLAFPIFFAGMWSFVCLLISRLSGWSRMATRFATTEPPMGRRFAWQSGRVGMSNYNSVLNIDVSPRGMRLDVLGLFRIGHRPLFIPWSEIRNATTRRFLFWETVVFEVGSPSLAKVRLPKKVFAGQPIVIDGQAQSP
jgi:hypothetical protein